MTKNALHYIIAAMACCLLSSAASAQPSRSP